MPPNRRFLQWIKYGTLQYVLIVPILGFLAAGLNWANAYGEGEINWNKGYVYIALVQNFSQLFALYALVWFYVIILAVFRAVRLTFVGF